MVFHEEETKGQKVALKRLFLALNLTLIKKSLHLLKKEIFSIIAVSHVFAPVPPLSHPFALVLF